MFNSDARTLVIKLCLIGVLVCLVILGLDALYRHTYDVRYQKSRVLLPSPTLEEPYQLVKLGNSHAVDGIDLSRYRLKSLDGTGVAQRFSFDLALLKQHRQQIADNAIILIAVTPISFSHREADQKDGLQRNYYGRLAPYLIPDLMLGDYLESEWFPQLRVGYQLRKEIRAAIVKRLSEEQSEKKIVDLTPSEVVPVVPTATLSPDSLQPEPVLSLEDSYYNVEAIQSELASAAASPTKIATNNMAFIFHKWYETDEFHPKYFAQNRRDLEKLIDYALEQRWRPILVTIPVSAVLQEGLLDDYMQKYLYENLEQTELQGTEYMDFSQNSRLINNESYFSNVDHLNKKGAATFSYLLLQKLIDRGYLPTTADGYDYRIVANPAQEK